MWKWPVVKYKQIKIKPRICILFILCSTWTVNANSLKQNIIVIKQISSWLQPFAKQNLLFIQPRFVRNRVEIKSVTKKKKNDTFLAFFGIAVKWP